MKFIHFSDTHLGFSDLTRVDTETGMNQREADFYAAWNQVIDAILDEKPDFVVHAGDLFHTPRPNNRALHCAFEGIQKLSNAGIPFVVVAGNHSTPRIRNTGSIFESIALFPHVYAAWQGAYQRFRIGECAVHCIPHCSLSEELDAAYEAISVDEDARYQILVTHGAWRETSDETIGSVGEFNEQFIENPEKRTGLTFDYIALGHYHKHIPVGRTIVYSGSTERTSFNETGYSSGYVRVDLQAKKWRYVPISSRPMLSLGPIDCSGLSLDKIYAAIAALPEDVPDGALIRLELTHVARDCVLGMSTETIDSYFPQALYVEKIIHPEAASDISHSSTMIGSLSVEFERFLKEQQGSELDPGKLLELGRGLLDQAVSG